MTPKRGDPFPLVLLLYIILQRNSIHMSHILSQYFENIPLYGLRTIYHRPMCSACEDSLAISQIMHSQFSVNGTQHLLLSNGESKDNEEKDEETAQDKAEAKIEQPQEEQKAEEQKERPSEQEEQPVRRSRIETYDELARFRNSSRPPDSHYPPGPVGGFKRSSGTLVSGSVILTHSVIALVVILHRG